MSSFHSLQKVWKLIYSSDLMLWLVKGSVWLELEEIRSFGLVHLGGDRV